MKLVGLMLVALLFDVSPYPRPFAAIPWLNIASYDIIVTRSLVNGFFRNLSPCTNSVNEEAQAIAPIAE